jgi:hypothetical protein
MKKNKKRILYCYCYFFFFRSSSTVPHLYSAHLILLSTLAFFRRRKETISTEDVSVLRADIPKERGVV